MSCAVYEAVWGQGVDPRNFHNKVTSAQDFLVETGERTTRGGGTTGPAVCRRAGPAAAPAGAAAGLDRRES